MSTFPVSDNARSIVRDSDELVYACMCMAECVSPTQNGWARSKGAAALRVIAGFMGVVAELVHERQTDEECPLWEAMYMDGYDTDYIPWVADWFLNDEIGTTFVSRLLSGEGVQKMLAEASMALQEHVIEYLQGMEPEDDGQPDERQEWHDFDPDC